MISLKMILCVIGFWERYRIVNRKKNLRSVPYHLLKFCLIVFHYRIVA